MAEQTLTGGMKLTLIQNEMKAPKTEFNNFGGFKYRTTGEINYFLKPLCAKYHTQVVSTTESVAMGWADTLIGVYQKATVSMLDADTGELIAESTAMAREDDDRKKMSAPQLTASAAQFAVKRALEQLLMLDDSAPEVDAMSPERSATQQVQRQIPQPRQARPAQPQRAKPVPRPEIYDSDDIPVGRNGLPQPLLTKTAASVQAKPVQQPRLAQNAPQMAQKAQPVQTPQPAVNAPQTAVKQLVKPAGPRAGWAQKLKEYDAQQKAQADPWAATMKDTK